MMADHENVVVPLILAALAPCGWTWLMFPSTRCATFASGCFVLAVPFWLDVIDHTPHGHPDLRGAAFLFLGFPLLGAGIVASVVGLCRRTQNRRACIAALFVGVALLLSALVSAPPGLLMM